MDAVELILPDGKPSRVWMCLECRRLVNRSYQPLGDGKGRDYTPEERDEFARLEAIQCCQEAHCACGTGLGRKKRDGGYTTCPACRAAADESRRRAKFEKAAKLTPEEWAKSPAGMNMLYDERADRWFHNLDDVEDWYADDPERERPEYLWCSEEVDWEPDVSGWIGDHMADHYHEDADESIPAAEWKRLDDFVETWWEDNKPTSYEPDYSRCVLLLPPEVVADVPLEVNG